MRDYGLEAQRKAEAHLNECWAALQEQEDADFAGEWESNGADRWPVTAGPFCGCETCVVREVLFIAWPIFHEAAKSGVAP